MHIHLDLVGGIAGDMFNASMLDALPHLELPLLEVLAAVKETAQVNYWTEEAIDKGLTGRRFYVENQNDKSEHHHEHRSWKHIQYLISELSIDESVKKNTLGIFSLLAEAEAKIHGKNVEDVHFHEVGAWDCIVDILSASWLIVNSKATSWSCSDIPWGGGIVHCAHGDIPVPAPATLSLLKGFQMIDDGIKGERVTPTGAAILAWLLPSHKVKTGQVVNIGYGFGKRELSGRANLLRSTILSTTKRTHDNHEEISVIQFDIDDMTGELLAIAREKIRSQQGVLEITEVVAHGKKNRHINTITVLTQLTVQDSILEFIFNHTSTLGVRYWRCQRKLLPRHHHQVTVDNTQYNVKTARRPDGTLTSKLESSHLEPHQMSLNNQVEIKILTEKLANHELTKQQD
ncbi:nickel pincer cofactor biosynthesis protein LarC [Vibrio sp. NH-UV-68]|uniref:nickel pincer cofactor biosynthesis protein LarC n=1 Tax=unclassified Vibrio TaxID=2614977 RepID=UPI0036F3510D